MRLGFLFYSLAFLWRGGEGGGGEGDGGMRLRWVFLNYQFVAKEYFLTIKLLYQKSLANVCSVEGLFAQKKKKDK